MPIAAYKAALETANPEAGEVVFIQRREQLDGHAWGDALGTIDEETRQQVARPYLYLDKPHIFGEQASSWTSEDGTKHEEYVVFRRENLNRIAQPTEVKETAVDPELGAAVENAMNGLRSPSLRVGISLRDFPQWDIPLRANPGTTDLETVEEVNNSRRSALDARRQTFLRLSEPVIKAVEALGGQVAARGEYGGWLVADLPVEAVLKLATMHEIESLNLEEAVGVEDWPLGEGRTAARTDIDQLHSAGYDGFWDTGTTSGRVKIGLLEIGGNGPLMGACFQYTGDDPDNDGNKCESDSFNRVVATYRCDDQDGDGNLCEPGTYPTPTGGHATVVLSTLMGDYTEGQANGVSVGDSNFGNATCSSGSQCTSGTCELGKCAHATILENQASGMAPEATVAMFAMGTTSADYADALDDSIDLGVDIASMSFSLSGNCSARANLTVEKEAENAFDDGILVVKSSGNELSPGTCTIGTPGAVPKVLTVTGLNGSNSSCMSDYHENCFAEDTNSEEGGADVLIAGSPLPRGLSLISMAAPAELSHLTSMKDASGNFAAKGDIREDVAVPGSSLATPIVAGAAALIKDWALSTGQTWIGSPGRLHTVMLGMTDMHTHAVGDPYGDTVYLGNLKSSSKIYGLGRLKLRNPDSLWGWALRTFSLTAQGQVVGLDPWTGNFSGSVDEVRCAAYQFQDTSSETADPITISWVNMKVSVRTRQGSACTGAVSADSIGVLTDVRAAASVRRDAPVNLTGKCLRVELEAVQLESGGVSGLVFCQAGSEYADEP